MSVREPKYWTMASAKPFSASVPLTSAISTGFS
jgi:hypothetical protein